MHWFALSCVFNSFSVIYWLQFITKNYGSLGREWPATVSFDFLLSLIYALNQYNLMGSISIYIVWTNVDGTNHLFDDMWKVTLSGMNISVGWQFLNICTKLSLNKNWLLILSNTSKFSASILIPVCHTQL